MIEGKTKSGFAFKITDETLDDYELLEMIMDIDGGAGEKTTSMVTKLLGTDQKNALKDHVRDENGRVSATRLMEEIVEIFSACDVGKNS